MDRPDVKLAMQTLAIARSLSLPLPDPRLIWQRAAVRSRWRQYEQVTRSIRIAEWAAGIVCAITGIAGLLAVRPGVEAVLGVMDKTLVRLLGMTVSLTAAIALLLVNALRAEE